MPIYEYVCRDCGDRFTRMRAMSDRLSPPECAACASPRTSLALSVPGRVGASAPSAAAAGPCGIDTGSCCGGACMH